VPDIAAGRVCIAKHHKMNAETTNHRGPANQTDGKLLMDYGLLQYDCF